MAILETIAIRTALGKVWSVLKSVPWYVWFALAIAGLWWWDRGAQYDQGYENGRESVLEQLRTAEAEAGEKALKSAAQADEKGLERAEAEADAVSEIIERVEKAEAAGENPLDAVF